MAAGELRSSDRHEIDTAIRAAEQASRYEFSVFVGKADGAPREFATRLHAASVAPDRSVLILVDPRARVIEVVTGADVRRTLDDQSVELAVLQMRSSFAEGDLVVGLVRGIAQLAEHARAPQTRHAH
ncbi:DUF5130 family protein [Nocardioides euryhalodurans]|uniref:DUF5130 family protein n=1 Tax=Nocardioides euryhalodurans TaxID=2518370 RepID=A0A4V1BEA2_9ACTN|nr:DUF5130 family protein [Nocardioides euryhalodurans]QBR93912.1 DUF5130 family protein [Nocardioides euryhalodurans]